jgi:hypothetical protein
LLNLSLRALDHAPGPATLGDQSETGARPRDHAPVEILGLKPTLAEAFRGAIASGPAAADRDHDLLFRNLREARAELA